MNTVTVYTGGSCIAHERIYHSITILYILENSEYPYHH